MSAKKRPEFLISETMAEYNAARKNYITSSQVLQFSRSPILCTIEKESTVAQDFGTAAHKYILEGPEAFAKEYVIGGPINPRTGGTFGRGTKAFDEWLAARPGMGVVTEEELATIKAMHKSCVEHKHIGPCLKAGWAEVVARAKYYGAPCQIRIDWLTEGGTICDLKTCADIGQFHWDLRKYGYGIKASFYRQVYMAAAGDLAEPDYRLIVVETQKPYRSGVWMFTADVMDAVHAGARADIAGIMEAKRTGVWPTGFEEIQIAEVA